MDRYCEECGRRIEPWDPLTCEEYPEIYDDWRRRNIEAGVNPENGHAISCSHGKAFPKHG